MSEDAALSHWTRICNGNNQQVAQFVGPSALGLQPVVWCKASPGRNENSVTLMGL